MNGRDDKVLDAFYRAQNAESGVEELIKVVEALTAKVSALETKSKASKATVADASAKETE